MEVKVNGQLIELGDSMPAITKKSIDVNNPTSRFVDFTNKFVLPDTVKNRNIFENPNAVGTNNRSFEKIYDVSIFDVFEIFQGKGRLTSSKKNTFDLQVIDNSKDLFNALNAKLNTVNWDDKDTILTQAAIDAQDEYDVDNCWIWGKMCCHVRPTIINTDQTTGDDRTKYSRPQFNVNALLKKALAAQGYTFIEPDERLAISSNHKQFYFTDYQKSFSNVNFSVTGSQQITDWDTYDFKEASVTAVSASVKGLSKHSYRVRGTFTASEGMYLQLYSIDQTGTKPIYNTIQLPESGFLDYTTSLIYDGVTGMTTTFTIIGTGSVTFEDVLVYKVVDEKEEDLSTNHFLNHYIKAYDNLPSEMTYIDLYKLICVLFNKYPIVDTYNKVFSFGSLSNLSKLNSVDWSNKFVIGSEQISNDYSGLFQKNIIRWTNDETLQYSHAESYFTTDNESLKAEGDYLVIPYSSSIDVIVNSNTIAHAEIYNDTTRITDHEIGQRVFLIEGTRLTFDNLHADEMIEYYYKRWFDSLNRVRLITCEANLSKLDVIKWNEKQLVYIDYFKTTFIVLEISNFIPGRLTKIKLLAYGR